MDEDEDDPVTWTDEDEPVRKVSASLTPGTWERLMQYALDNRVTVCSAAARLIEQALTATPPSPQSPG
jgi:hypothetical protein